MIDPTEVERYKAKSNAVAIVIVVLCVALLTYMIAATLLLDFMLMYEAV